MVRYVNWCRSFADEAAAVWNDMSDANRLGIARQEETTTEELLLNLARKHAGRGLDIRSFSRAEESAIGADWAFWFVDAQFKGIELRIQAKRLFPNSGIYESLFHQSPAQKKDAKSGGGDTPNQCETLIANCGKAIPVYVFYNSDALEGATAPVALAVCSPLGVPVLQESWGISVASAFSVKQADWGKKNSPDDFLQFPWHLLFCSCYWPDRPVDQTLPTLLGNGLRHLFRFDRDPEAENLSFEPHENPPDWVGLLRESATNPDQLLRYMSDQNLKGVAIVAERPIDE